MHYISVSFNPSIYLTFPHGDLTGIFNYLTFWSKPTFRSSPTYQLSLCLLSLCEISPHSVSCSSQKPGISFDASLRSLLSPHIEQSYPVISKIYPRHILFSHSHCHSFLISCPPPFILLKIQVPFCLYPVWSLSPPPIALGNNNKANSNPLFGAELFGSYLQASLHFTPSSPCSLCLNSTGLFSGP